MFQNPKIPLNELPDTDELAWESLHPLYARSIRVLAIAIVTIIAIAILVLSFVPNIPLTPFVFLYSLLAILLPAEPCFTALPPTEGHSRNGEKYAIPCPRSSSGCEGTFRGLCMASRPIQTPT